MTIIRLQTLLNNFLLAMVWSIVIRSSLWLLEQDLLGRQMLIVTAVVLAL
jgi:hypothetical protein